MKFMTIPEYSAHSGFPKSKIRLMIGKGEIVAKKLDGRWYISLEQTEEQLQQMFERPERDRYFRQSWKNDGDYKAMLKASMKRAVAEACAKDKQKAVVR